MPCRVGLRFVLVVLLLAATAPPGFAGPAPGLLEDYVARPAQGFGFTVRDSGRYRGAEWVELILTSQTWRGLPWRHQLYLIRPARLPAGPRHALLFIDGGKWRAEYAAPPVTRQLPKRAAVYLGIANRLAAPVAVLRQVPNQPLFDGLSEDALIAYTLDRYLETGEPDWPLLLPMARSAVSAMDAVQRYAAERWSIEVSGFTVTGASKRGWTTWLTAAVDPRVAAIAPMVFDVLNMAPQLDHQRASWGALSEQLADYSDRSLTARLGTPDGERLAALVDPFAYRERISQPKVVILATNDRYWPVDAATLYWSGLRGSGYPLYVPNQGHKLTDLRRIVGALAAVHAAGAGSEPLPELRWRWAEEGTRLELQVEAKPRPAAVYAWVARAPTRDLREARWRAVPMRLRNGRYRHPVSRSATGYLGVFGEAVFGHGSRQVFLSTLPVIAGRGEVPRLVPGGEPLR